MQRWNNRPCVHLHWKQSVSSQRYQTAVVPAARAR
jgi:hypothetical protein